MQISKAIEGPVTLGRKSAARQDVLWMDSWGQVLAGEDKASCLGVRQSTQAVGKKACPRSSRHQKSDMRFKVNARELFPRHVHIMSLQRL